MKTTLTSTLLAAALAAASCSNDKVDRSAESGRLDRIVARAQEDPKQEELGVGDDQGGTGSRMALDEGKMGERESRPVTGQYAMNGNGASRRARNAGVLGGMGGPSGGQGWGYGTEASNTEHYTDYGENPMVTTSEDPLSTFAVDVDTASYVIARRKILDGQLPPASSVRVEEFVNYFGYEYAGPTDDAPFAVHMDMAPSPFSKERHFLRVGVQGKALSRAERKPVHLTFLVDVSGSMSTPDKLGLAKRALRILVENLNDGDTVALVTYAGATRVVLAPTGLEHRSAILSAIEDLQSGGGTAMGSGVELAYEQAERTLSPGSESRVIVLSDGDANIGRTTHKDILRTIKGKVKEGVTLSTIGFGMGNYKDTLMEQLANKGNGNYYYIDGLSEAKRVFQEQLGGTLEVIAKDVKLQVDFDPEIVKSYRLVGYENRDIADRDFRDDKVDAGEIGAGHTVTAVYELALERRDTPPAVVRIRHKAPRGTRASERAYAFEMDRAYATFERAPDDLRFAVAVAAAAEVLRHSEHASDWSLAEIARIASGSRGRGRADRDELVTLIERLIAMEPQFAAR